MPWWGIKPQAYHRLHEYFTEETHSLIFAEVWALEIILMRLTNFQNFRLFRKKKDHFANGHLAPRLYNCCNQCQSLPMYQAHTVPHTWVSKCSKAQESWIYMSGFKSLSEQDDQLFSLFTLFAYHQPLKSEKWKHIISDNKLRASWQLLFRETGDSGFQKQYLKQSFNQKQKLAKPCPSNWDLHTLLSDTVLCSFGCFSCYQFKFMSEIISKR